jgi:regulator of replication initiation timing
MGMFTEASDELENAKKKILELKTMNTTKLRKDLDQLIFDYNRLEEENNHLKTLLYRMVATHGNRIEPTPYLPRKGAKIHSMKVVSTGDRINFEVNHVEQVCPNNSEAEV